MTARIARLTVAELLKTVSHPFFYFSVGALVVVIPLWAYLQPKVTGYEETVWRGYHAVQLFAYGARPGLKLATFLLLARPVTRTDVFLAKCAAAAALLLFLVGVVLYVSAAFGLARGELGPVWDEQSPTTSGSAAAILAQAGTAVLYLLLPTLAAAFLGLLVSNLVDSSGYAVAGALVAYVVLDIAPAFLPPGDAQVLFNFYPGYALDALRYAAEGEPRPWLHQEPGAHLYWTAPLASFALFASAAYLRFRAKDILA